MKIVIDIDDSFYYGIVSNKYGVYTGRIFNIICNGTPLPKGHGKLIDADELLQQTLYNPLHVPYISKEDILNIPTIIEADKEDQNG